MKYRVTYQESEFRPNSWVFVGDYYWDEAVRIRDEWIARGFKARIGT